MITPSKISVKPEKVNIVVSDYSFPDQTREEGKFPLLAYYTWNSMQTYNYQGYPSDTSGDNWD
jgi:hypothetical protein